MKKRQIDDVFNCHFGAVTSLDWNYNDNFIASSSSTGDIIVHNFNNKIPISSFSSQNSTGVKMVKFQPQSSNIIASASNDGSVGIWDILRKQQQFNFEEIHNSRVTSVCFSPQNPILVCSGSLDKTIIFYDVQNNKKLKTLNCDTPITSIAFHSNGHNLACESASRAQYD
ncbi:WD40-repeat-containing domain [Pseudocohnilembus persalinus]|uniref:WD40-repeat-containing domain n=1 Tax=Pseudocohnilembus persalinus TaxID=266149 RepID=A0A0V0QHZ2_PSEPJ|nr:WD40-repeat-containing domain [Pseudocohnilembus persalinus]|eukprot:KRX01798.1 WD40-repeat-containing domain [Pseudocohnilembus persalinus]